MGNYFVSIGIDTTKNVVHTEYRDINLNSHQLHNILLQISSKEKGTMPPNFTFPSEPKPTTNT
jgi:hypothetical protein